LPSLKIQEVGLIEIESCTSGKVRIPNGIDGLRRLEALQQIKVQYSLIDRSWFYGDCFILKFNRNHLFINIMTFLE
jgi:hypothetical protein